MINIQIDEETLLNLFMDRLEYWTSDGDVQNLYEEYLKGLIDGGCFEGAELDVSSIIDNLYINDTIILSKENLEEYGYSTDDDKILIEDTDNDLYLVSTY